ncbi:MAG: hypothetical protein IRY95_08555 [Clostridia bacterium]|nr:hypothetical protein [Clostridia bacterium]
MAFVGLFRDGADVVEDRARWLLRMAAALPPRLSCQVALVDSGSRDETPAILSRLAAGHGVAMVESGGGVDGVLERLAPGVPLVVILDLRAPAAAAAACEALALLQRGALAARGGMFHGGSSGPTGVAAHGSHRRGGAGGDVQRPDRSLFTSSTN